MNKDNWIDEQLKLWELVEIDILFTQEDIQKHHEETSKIYRKIIEETNDH